jgi:nucleotide-binding universal stress UspA family protein
MRTILVALDDSARAGDVLTAAARMAARFDATLIPFQAVLVPPDIPPAAHIDHGDPLPERMVRDAERSLRAKCAACAALTGVRVAEPVVREGAPAHTIVAIATELDVDMIVIGSHGYHGLDRVLGTTAASVVNHSAKNVFVVHDKVAS